jgi:hypothetical protein
MEINPLLTQMPHESLMDWLKTPKTWIAGGALLFTLGGTVTVVRDSFQRNDALITDTHKLVEEHERHAEDALKMSLQNSEQVQQLLQEVVRVGKVNCLNTAKDDYSRRACVGLDHN